MLLKIGAYIFFIFFIVGSCFGQTDLDTSKNELNKGKRNNTESDYNQQNPTCNSSKNFGDELKDNLIGDLMIYIGAAIVGNYSTEDHLHNPISKYPYKDPLNGNYTKPGSANIHKGLRFDIEDQFLFSNKDLYGNHFKAKLRPFHYFYFKSEMFQLFEYNRSVDRHSNLLLYNVDFCYDRLRFERFNIGLTAGANYVANDVKKGGFAFGFNTDIFIAKPISIYSSVKWSSVNGQPVNTLEIQGKYHKNNFFVSLGYQHVRIAAPAYNFVSFGLGIYL